MDERKIQEAIQRGRDFLKSQDTAELERNGSDYKTDQELKKPQPPLVKAPMTENRIDLPRNFESLSLEDNLYQLLAKRKSSRVYTQEDMSLLQLSFLLWATQGIKSIRGKSYATIRTAPCGGARHPFETYLLVRQVEGLLPGAYHYLPMTHQLELLAPPGGQGGAVRPGGGEPVRPALGGQKQRGVLLELCALPQRVALRHPRPPDDYGGHGPRGGEPVPGLHRLGPGHLRHRRL